MSSANEAIIEFDVVINTRLSAATKEQIDELKEVQAQSEKISAGEGAKDPLAGFVAKEESIEDIKPELIEALNSMDASDIKQFAQFAKDPLTAGTAGIEKVLTRLLGSGATAILGPLAIAIASPIVMAEFIKAMSVKGGPLNRDWRRFIEAEVEVGLSRVQQKEKELGITQVILTQVVGFNPNNENFTYNSLFEVNESRLARIGLDDRSAGVTMFLG